MMDSKHTFGYIIKKEQLESPAGYTGKKAALLVASNPFPGYKGNTDRNYYYLVLDNKKSISTDELIRITQLILRSLKKKPDICTCEITLYNKVYKALRIYTREMQHISELIEHYQVYGLCFLPNQLIKPFISQIRVFKFFELSGIQNGIYESNTSPVFKYIQIPDKLEWVEFEYLVAQAKKEKSFDNCDFAIASFYSKEGFDDFIRVYSNACTRENLTSFRDFILKTIQQHALK